MDYVWAYTLAKGNTVQVDHGIGGYPWTFLIGPFDYKNSNLHFSYDNGDDFHCDWNDSESWKRCGECRTGLWSAPKLNCKGGGEKTRVSGSFFLNVRVLEVGFANCGMIVEKDYELLVHYGVEK